MCFSNLPIEFDEQGNPYLAEEADTVNQPGGGTHDHNHDHNHDDHHRNETEGGDPDPEAMYATIMDSLPEDARQRIAEAGETTPPNGDAHDKEPARGD